MNPGLLTHRFYSVHPLLTLAKSISQRSIVSQVRTQKRRSIDLAANVTQQFGRMDEHVGKAELCQHLYTDPIPENDSASTMQIISKLILNTMFRRNRSLGVSILLIFASLTAQAEDQVLPYAPEEPLFVNQSYPRGLEEHELKDMAISDPQLRIAYAFLIRAAMGGPKIVDERTPEMVATLNDLKRRGDSATPLMLDIMAKNHNTRHEHLIPHVISRIGTNKMEPYLEYLRQMMKTRPDEISAAANEVAAKLFLEHGTADDARMVEELAKKRPFLAPSLERAHEFQRWKHPDRSKATEATPTSAAPVTLPLVQQSPPKKAPVAKPATTTEEPASTSWLVWGIVIVAAGGLLWLLLNRRS